MYGAVKRLLASIAVATLEEQLEAEADAVAGLGAGLTGHLGVLAFLTKQTPVFP